MSDEENNDDKFLDGCFHQNFNLVQLYCLLHLKSVSPRLVVRMYTLIAVKAYCQTKRLRQLRSGTGSLLVGHINRVVKIVIHDLGSIEGLAFESTP